MIKLLSIIFDIIFTFIFYLSIYKLWLVRFWTLGWRSQELIILYLNEVLINCGHSDDGLFNAIYYNKLD